MNELFPILGGLTAGICAALMPLRAKVPLAALLGSVIGLLATVWSGEYQVSWYFLPIDGVLAISAALAPLVLTAGWRTRSNSVVRVGLGQKFNRRSVGYRCGGSGAVCGGACGD
jgi:hypothetical protein